MEYIFYFLDAWTEPRGKLLSDCSTAKTKEIYFSLALKHIALRESQEIA